MILSLNGSLAVFAAYANLLTLASFLDIEVATTRRYASHPVVKILLLYVFAYSVISDKLACLLAVALFSIVEVRQFVTDAPMTEEPPTAAAEETKPSEHVATMPVAASSVEYDYDEQSDYDS